MQNIKATGYDQQTATNVKSHINLVEVINHEILD